MHGHNKCPFTGVTNYGKVCRKARLEVRAEPSNRMLSKATQDHSGLYVLVSGRVACFNRQRTPSVYGFSTASSRKKSKKDWIPLVDAN